MMNYLETPVLFGPAGEHLVGILAKPASPYEIGVVILVGGPQYRVGSHRQFVLLARHLAESGYAVMRFDFTGMGDSAGEAMGFDCSSDDIALALNAFRSACPTIEKVVLWGLCDAASAALLYWAERQDACLAGMCLLNPWVRSDVTLAKAHVKHYYAQRLLEPEFWRNLVVGKVRVATSFRQLYENLRLTLRRQSAAQGVEPFPVRMASGLRTFEGRVLLVLSGRDLTAKEFLECVGSQSCWSGLLDRPNVTRRDISAADHTFSSARDRRLVEHGVLEWLNRIREENGYSM